MIAAFAGALVLLFIGAGFTYRASVDFTGSVEGVSRGEQLREALANLQTGLVGAESAQAAYLLTSRTDQREEYDRLVAGVRGYRQAIAARAAADPAQAADLAELDTHLEKRLELLTDVIALYDEAGLSSARSASTPRT